MNLDPRNSGHGHVYQRPDGVRTRCGGPAICDQCSRDLARKQAEENKGPALNHVKVELKVGDHLIVNGKDLMAESLEPEDDGKGPPPLKLKLHREPNWIEIKRDLSHVLNKHSLDVHQGTPDFMLADFLVRSLQMHREFILERQRWFKGVAL